ncbi:O-methyltransferase [Pseudobdellovibrio exovorus]|uniref:O-methyltransferase n=1 Tax=Pseudobdellovibrio exovorus JSS TaxID=1184267 RepID=M4VAK5_9BACT|nr:O-methyltransferase [Pseudobdellovibrio exovorus]AGH96437.1 O-methyltransferase [Pseudobdellovibrio exovorus JSS]
MRKVKSDRYSYIESLSEPEDKTKEKARNHSQQIGLDAISLSVVEARLIQFQLQSVSAKKVVEIGTLTGLSASYILEALPQDGKLWTIEKSPQHAELAEDVLDTEIKAGRCQIVVDDAQKALEGLSAEGPFDAVFIDGNKAAYLNYFEWALKNTKVGGVIIADNVFLAGSVWGDMSAQKFSEKQISVLNQMNRMAFQNKSLSSVIIPTEEGMLVCKKLS